MSLTLLALEWLILALVIGLAFFTSRWLRFRHLRQLSLAEARLTKIQLHQHSVDCQLSLGLVASELVISLDAFSTFGLLLLNLVGGSSRMANELLVRARREAVVRLKREAVALGATGIMQLRFEQLTFGSGDRRNQRRFCIQAYGTAYR